MCGVPSEQFLALLAVANSHGDMPDRISSLSKAKDVLLSVNSSLCAELLPPFLELHASPDSPVRKSIAESLEEIGSKRIELCHMLMPVLLAFLKDDDPTIANISIYTGASLLYRILGGIVSQCEAKEQGKIEKWLEELWIWMVKFKDAVSAIVLEPCFVGTRMVAMKFLEKCILLFTSHNDDSETNVTTATKEGRYSFNISSFTACDPVLDSATLILEANRFFDILLKFLQYSSDPPGSLMITAIHCLASVARKRPVRYSAVLSALLDLESSIRCLASGNFTSITYSIRSALLSFLRCTYPSIKESRDKLVSALQSLNAGDVADHVIRQVDKMVKDSERASRDPRVTRDGPAHGHLYTTGDHSKKRPIQEIEETACEEEAIAKRICRSADNDPELPIQINESEPDEKISNSTNVSILDNDMDPVEKMIAMIGALIAEGEPGVRSLEILVLNIHPDLLADIVILNMKYLPQSAPPLTGLGSSLLSGQSESFSVPASVEAETPSSAELLQSSVLTSKLPSASSLPDSPAVVNTDAKRDPRRDPRRSDPRRPMVSLGVALATSVVVEDEDASQSEICNTPLPPPLPNSECFSAPQAPLSNGYDHTFHTQLFIEPDKESLSHGSLNEIEEINSNLERPSAVAVSDAFLTPEDLVGQMQSGIPAADVSDSTPPVEFHLISSSDSNIPASGDIHVELCEPLPFTELTSAEKITLRMLAVRHIICSWKPTQSSECGRTRMELLARLLDQVDGDEDIILLLQKNIIFNYQHCKGHEVVLHILYYLHGLAISDENEHSLLSSALYENFFFVMAKSLLDNFPASDRSFSKLLGDAPILPDSVIKLLDELCHNDIFDGGEKEVRDMDRVTQGLGAVWSLILGRPPYRKVCLDIALNCAVHSKEEIRSKAIRLVANKLFLLAYTSEVIEQFAKDMLLSSIYEKAVEKEDSMVDSLEKSVSGSQISAPPMSLNDVKVTHNTGGSDSNTLGQKTQYLISLYFALCTKKPSLLKLVFTVYAQAPKIVKQAFVRHMPVLVRVLGPSCSDLLHIISDPPQGSETLLSQVLQVLAEGGSPSADLTSIVKHLYETKLKDVSILIPMLSSFSKTEVLPVFPQLVKLPLEKLQLALAYILQGSANTGPALTPVEVLVAIHDIIPEKDGIPLKKITDACSACFEQRTVFTQQVLIKALNQMVGQNPLPLLFMRTVIQAIDAFPTMVDFVMGILSKLVSKQVWKMPKLWFGFLKCVSQTKPHSFNVLLQLPPLQLESALTRHAHLRAPLSAYADQSLVRSSLPREILALLGMVKERQVLVPSLHPSDASSSIHGAMPT